MKYLVSHQGEQIGPVTAAEIVGRINARELDALDYAFDEAQQDWVLLTDLDEVARLLKARKPAAPPKPPAITTATTPAAPTAIEWFVLKGESKFGPYAADEIIGLLQQKIVYPFDHVWHAGLSDWTRVNELAAFHPDQVRGRLEQNAGVFIKRRFTRKPVQARVVLHDNLKLWRGEAMELSSGGLGVRLPPNARVVPGQTLHVHCGAQDGLHAFNATCEVVAVNVRSDDDTLECGLRFVSLSRDAQASINAKVA